MQARMSRRGSRNVAVVGVGVVRDERRHGRHAALAWHRPPLQTPLVRQEAVPAVLETSSRLEGHHLLDALLSRVPRLLL